MLSKHDNAPEAAQCFRSTGDGGGRINARSAEDVEVLTPRLRCVHWRGRREMRWNLYQRPVYFLIICRCCDRDSPVQDSWKDLFYEHQGLLINTDPKRQLDVARMWRWVRFLCSMVPQTPCMRDPATSRPWRSSCDMRPLSAVPRAT